MIWRTDVENAPRDGSPFLSDIVGPVACVTWYDAKRGRGYPWRFFWHMQSDDPVEKPHGNGFMDDYGPKHWMPLPEPPK